MSRLQDKFNELQSAHKKGLVIYLTAGIPDANGTLEAVKTAVDNGADVIELGIPFSDPMADGPVIQSASYKAIQKSPLESNVSREMPIFKGQSHLMVNIRTSSQDRYYSVTGRTE